MNSLKFALWLAIFATILGFNACEPFGNDVNNNQLPVEVKNLTGGASKTWKLELITAGTVDIPLESCDVDNRHVFSYLDSAYSYISGEEMCSGESATFTGKWSFKNNNTQLVIEIPSIGTRIYTIRELSSTSMALERNNKIETLVPEL